MRTHTIVNTNSALHSLSLLIVKIVFCKQLVGVWEDGEAWGSFRLIFLPFWISWFVTNVLSFFKDKNSRGYGDVRELQYLFFLFVACKLDGINHYSWKVVFVIPWVAFGVMFMMACLILVMLVITRSPYADRLLQVGIFCMCVSFSPQFVSYLRLVSQLDGVSSSSYEDILVPNIVSWTLLFLSSLIIYSGLYERERMRATWRMTERNMWEMHVQGAVMEAAQASVNYMTDDQVTRAAQAMAMGKVKPAELYRLSATLYRRLSHPPTSEEQDIESAPQGDLEKPGKDGGVGSHPLGGMSDVAEEDQTDGRVMTPSCSMNSAMTSALEAEAGATGGEGGASDVHLVIEDDHCIICYDRKPTCVFLECGHSGVCNICAHKMWIRPPHECPTCRATIDQVVEIEEQDTSEHNNRIGIKVAVKQ